MGDTFTKIYIHLVFTPYKREALIGKSWRDELEKYITGIIQNNGHKLIAIKSRPDHIHIFIGYYVNQPIPTLVENIKTSSTAWIKEKKFSRFQFRWQRGYGAFSHSHSQIDVVSNYIMNQDEHHEKVSFKPEYLDLLNKNEIEFKDEYLFDFFDDANDWDD